MEAQVFQQQSLAHFQLRGHFLGFRPDAIGAEADVFPTRQFFVEQHAQALGHRLQAQFEIGFALGPAEVRGQDQARSVAQSVLNSG